MTCSHCHGEGEVGVANREWPALVAIAALAAHPAPPSETADGATD